MAHVLPLLRAVARSTRRGLPTAGALLSNNFMILAFLITYEHPGNYRAFHLLLALLILFPLSLDPLRSLPRTRLALLPLGPWDRLRLRLGSLALSPALWLAAALLAARGRGLLWLVLAVPVLSNAGALVLERLRPGGVPRGPGLILPGRLGLLIQKNLREQLRVLDTWLALVMAVLGVASGPELASMATFMVVLALSTSAQQLFALDREAASRYRLLPLRGWEALLAKDAAFLLVLLPLVLFLAPLTGLVSGLAVLSAGNLISVYRPVGQAPWRLLRGASLGAGAAQILLLALAFAARSSLGPWALAPALALWAGSLFLGGRRLP